MFGLIRRIGLVATVVVALVTAANTWAAGVEVAPSTTVVSAQLSQTDAAVKPESGFSQQ